MLNKSLIIILVILIIPFTGCKKGDEDPFFSLLSRKARVSGDWQLSTIEGEIYTSYLPLENWHNAIKTGDNKEIITITDYANENLSRILTQTIRDYSMTINKDGTWSKTIQYNSLDVRETAESIYTYTFPIDMTFSGTWAFVGKTKDNYKNKERILLSINNFEILAYEQKSIREYKDGSPTFESTYVISGINLTYDSGEIENLYEIKMLKSKEMKWTLLSGEIYQETDISGEETENASETHSEETIVWKLK
ncbi:MAG: hypothetical protein GQ574_09715 [Crocinitomix sp.]|nr:hypothetical protein [Crocinitomix sp.]